VTTTTQDRIYSSTGYHEQKHGVSPEVSEFITRYRTNKFSAFLKKTTSEILEVGAGPGWNLIRLPAHRRVGMDVTLTYAERLRGQGVEFVSDLSQLSGQKFDLVILSHVMEHLLAGQDAGANWRAAEAGRRVIGDCSAGISRTQNLPAR
jgi:2-polyprenyl-3-methyl-5-hydroxy-6-metoxy-1,4-benzoquinol methylase